VPGVTAKAFTLAYAPPPPPPPPYAAEYLSLPPPPPPPQASTVIKETPAGAVHVLVPAAMKVLVVIAALAVATLSSMPHSLNSGRTVNVLI
jgi:hypothetical protein